MNEDKFKEWRALTPILLVTITILGGITSFFMAGALADIKESIHTSFTVISGVKSSFDDYKVTAESHFATLDTKIADISARIDGKQ